MATYQLGHSGQTWQLPKLDGMGSTYSPHQDLLPSLLLTWISWAGLRNRYVLPPRQTPPSPSHSSPRLSCLPLPFHYKSSLFPLCLGSLKLTFSAGTQDKRILVVHDGEKEGGLLVENGWWGQLGFRSLNRQGTLGMGLTQLGYMYEQQKKYTFESQ